MITVHGVRINEWVIQTFHTVIVEITSSFNKNPYTPCYFFRYMLNGFSSLICYQWKLRGICWLLLQRSPGQPVQKARQYPSCIHPITGLAVISKSRWSRVEENQYTTNLSTPPQPSRPHSVLTIPEITLEPPTPSRITDENTATSGLIEDPQSASNDSDLNSSSSDIDISVDDEELAD